MKTILRGRRCESAHWLCDGGDAGVSGGVSHHGDSANAARSRRMWVQASGVGQGSLPVAAGVSVPLTSPNSPFEPFSPETVAGRSKAVSMWMAVSPRCHGNGAGCQQAGGGRVRTISPQRSPRAAGTSNPASLHFTPLRSTEELSNDQLGGGEQALRGMQRCPLLLLTP